MNNLFCLCLGASSAMALQLSGDIVGAVLTAPSREQCCPSLPHQRVQQVLYSFYTRPLCWAPGSLSRGTYVQSVHLMNQPAAYLAAPFQASWVQGIALLAIIPFSRLWEGMSYMCFVFASDLACVLLNGHVQCWLKKWWQQTCHLDAYLVAYPVGVDTTSVAIE